MVTEKQENGFYLLVSFERGPALVIKIYMSKNTYMGEYIVLFPSTVQLIFIDSCHPPFQGLLPDINTEILFVFNKALEEKQSLLSLLGTHVLGLCFLE